MNLNESPVEKAALEWFADLGYATLNAAHIAPGEPAAERASFGDEVAGRRIGSDWNQRWAGIVPGCSNWRPGPESGQSTRF